MLLNCGVGEDSWESLGLQPVHPKGNQSWVFIGRTDVEAESPILWLPDAKRWLIWKDPDAGKDWGQEEKGMTEEEMVGWHYQLNGHEFESTPGVGDGQGGLVCCSPWGCKESDTTERLKWTELNQWQDTILVFLCLIYFTQYNNLISIFSLSFLSQGPETNELTHYWQFPSYSSLPHLYFSMCLYYIGP